MRYIGLFSGIEAATVAWEPLGREPVAFSEIDPFANAVLAERYPRAPNLGDITEVDWSQYAGYRKEVHGGFCGERNAALDALKDRVESIDLIRELVGSQRCEGCPDFEPKPLETGQTDNRVTGEEIDALMEAAEFSDCKLYGNTTVVTAKSPNGWTITEQSACIDPDNYDHDLGVEICKKRIEDELWKLEGYRKVCERAVRDGEQG